MTRLKSEKAATILLDLYRSALPYLDDYPWEWESDRWNELCICMLCTEFGIEPDLARKTIETIDQLGMMPVSVLTDCQDEQLVFVKRVMLQCGIDSSIIDPATELIVSLAQTVTKKWGGHIQRLLRNHGEKMAETLAKELERSGIHQNYAKKIATIWLQNVANIPILLDDDAHILSFRKQFGMTRQDLLDTADSIGINVSVLDDLLAIQANSNNHRQKKASQKQMKSAKRR